MSFLGGLIGGLGGLLGGIGSQNQANQANAAAQQDIAGLNNIMQMIQGPAQQLMQNYTSPGGGGNILQMLGPALLGQMGQLYSNQYTQGAGNVAAGLEGFQGLKPQEMSNLQTQMGAGTMQMINTLRSQLGGTANPNATIEGLTSQAMQQQLGLGSQLGALGAEQELGAQQAAGNIFEGLGQQQLGFQGQILNALLGTTGQQQQGLQTGLSGLEGLGQQYAGMAGAASNAAAQAGQQAQQGFGNLFSSIGSLFL